MNATVDTDGLTPTPSYRVDGLEVRDGHVPSTIMAFLRASVASDRGRLSQVLAPDLKVADHRTASVSPIPDRHRMIESLATFGPNTFDIRMLAVRCDVLGMFRVRIARTEGGVADILVVVRCTEAGQMDRMILHDTTDVAGAVTSLDTMYGRSLDRERVAAGRVLYQLGQRFLAGDTEGFAALMAPEMRSVDRRDGELVVYAGAEAVAMVWASSEGIDDQVSYTTEVHAATARGMVISHTYATVETLGITEPDVMVIGVRDGMVDVLDYFDGDDVTTALGRFAELN